MKYEELTKKIIGCAMKVHSTLGNGFQEVIYQRALRIEMLYNGLNQVIIKSRKSRYRQIGKLMWQEY